MNTKKIILLAATLLILGILYYGIEDPRSTRKPVGPEAFAPDFDRAAAAEISIQVPDGGPVVLTRKHDAWQVTADNQTWRADTDPVDALLANVVALKVDTIASRNPRNFEAFAVTEDAGVQVRITDSAGAVRAHFLVGKSGPDIFSTYIRSAGSDNVVLTGGILKTIYDRPLSEWRDKTIFTLPESAVAEYRIAGDRELQLRKGDDAVWQLLSPESFVPEQSAVKKAVEQFVALKAADFAGDNDTRTGLAEPARTITAHLADGTSQSLLVGREKNTFQTFVRPVSAEQVYVLENHVLEALCPTPEALRTAEQPPESGESAPAPDNETAMPGLGR